MSSRWPGVPQARRRGERWTPEEDAQLLAAKGSSRDYRRALAARLGRTLHGVHRRYHELTLREAASND